MLFNSFPFLIVFLPIAFVGTLALLRYGGLRLTIGWLVLCSLTFYAYWNPAHLWVIVVSVLVNYGVGITLATTSYERIRVWILAAGVAFDLGLLGVFKYSDFFLDIVGQNQAGFMGTITAVALPIGISFFTFQQIAFLVDAYRDRGQYRFIEYAFFVTFFPQLIAGPIVHHSEIIPQLQKIAERIWSRRYATAYLAPGLAILSIGLGKKMILADQFGNFADLPFDAAAKGAQLSFIEAWGGATSYAFQIYFDFSAYSDMAIGLGLLFALKLPMNFNSPYKARSIIDFWRRWHITLSRFLRDYLYIALGGNRRGVLRRYANLLITMILGGLWHGAAWTFVLWGALHGLLLVVNHGWHRLVGWRPPVPLAVMVTFALVIFTWVPFRADGFAVVLEFWRTMLGFDGIQLPARYGAIVDVLGPVANFFGLRVGEVTEFGGLRQLALLLTGLIIVWFTPNAVLLLESSRRRQFLASRAAACFVGFTLTAALIAIYVRDEVTFLYFQF